MFQLKLNNCVTIIQHILYEKMIPFFKSIGIKYVFASHCLKEKIVDDVKIYPFFLYCNIYDIKPSTNNDLLCNGIYGVNTNKKRSDSNTKADRARSFRSSNTNHTFYIYVHEYKIQNVTISILFFFCFDPMIRLIKFID